MAVLPVPSAAKLRIDHRELEWSTCRGSGAGGQHRNVTDSAVQLKHRSTGITVRCESQRSQHQNRETALSILRARMDEMVRDIADTRRSRERRQQVGSGMRGDKRRTIRTQDGRVTDHVTGKTWRYSDYVRGDW